MIEEELLKKVRERAQNENRTLSCCIRNILKIEIKNENNKNEIKRYLGNLPTSLLKLEVSSANYKLKGVLYSLPNI